MKPARKLKAVTEENRRPNVIRPELNLEQWCIWQPASSRAKPQVKVLEKEITLADGTPATAKVLVDYTSLGVLNTDDQKTLYGLVKLWEEKGESITYTYVSVSQLLKTLKKTRGRDTVKAVVKSLRRLRKNTIDWEHSYIDGETGERVTSLEDPFTIVSELKIIHREKNGKPVREEGYFRFHPLILKNLRANHRKPLLFDVVLSFKGDIAQLLYTQLDRVLSEMNRYERRTKELFEELGLIGKEYQKPSARKRTLERALSELQGKPLSKGGVISKARVVLTVDQSDYKVIFEKGNAKKTLPAPKEEPPQEESELVKRLRDEFGISPARAHQIEELYAKSALEWLEAKKHVHDWKQKGAGFWVDAITKGFELPLSYRNAKEKAVEVRQEKEKRAYEEARRLHEEHFRDEYTAYFAARIERIRLENPTEWKAFEEATAGERRKTFKLISEESGMGKGIFQSMVCDYFGEHPRCPVLNFWQWDATLNPKPFRFDG